MISVLLVDDEALVRSGLALILGAVSDITVVGSVDGPDALAAIEQLHPDIVLLDIRMPGMDGLDILQELSSAQNRPIVSMLTTFDSDEYLWAALDRGAAGFLLKDTDPISLPGYIRALASGGTILAPGINAAALLRRGADQNHRQSLSTLSSRELNALKLLSRGLSNPAIASGLHVSLGTVKDDISSILDKLGVGSRVEAALIACQSGLLDADPESTP